LLNRNDQINLRKSVKSKLQQTELQSALQKQRRHLNMQKRQYAVTLFVLYRCTFAHPYLFTWLFILLTAWYTIVNENGATP